MLILKSIFDIFFYLALKSLMVCNQINHHWLFILFNQNPIYVILVSCPSFLTPQENPVMFYVFSILKLNLSIPD
jgi:hypothetical protein